MICEVCGESKCAPDCENAWELMTKAERVLSVLRHLGGEADNRKIAELADSGPPGDVATILSDLRRRKRVHKVGFGKVENGVRPPSVWRIMGRAMTYVKRVNSGALNADGSVPKEESSSL